MRWLSALEWLITPPSGVTHAGVINASTFPGIAQPFSRAGTITSLAGFISTQECSASLIGSTITLTAQLYTSTTPDNTLWPCRGDLHLCTGLDGDLAVGHGQQLPDHGPGIPVAADDCRDGDRGGRPQVWLRPSPRCGASASVELQ
jgi:hypothetical protein